MLVTFLPSISDGTITSFSMSSSKYACRTISTVPSSNTQYANLPYHTGSVPTVPFSVPKAGSPSSSVTISLSHRRSSRHAFPCCSSFAGTDAAAFPAGRAAADTTMASSIDKIRFLIPDITSSSNSLCIFHNFSNYNFKFLENITKSLYFYIHFFTIYFFPILQLLDAIQVIGFVIKADAMGTQTRIAAKIKQTHADYTLAIEKNKKSILGNH